MLTAWGDGTSPLVRRQNLKTMMSAWMRCLISFLKHRLVHNETAKAGRGRMLHQHDLALDLVHSCLCFARQKSGKVTKNNL